MRFSLTFLACLLAAGAAQATGLLESWMAASVNDPDWAVANAAHAAAAPRRDQANALWRPTVTLNATVGIANSATQTQGAQFSAPGFGRSTGVDFATSVNGGSSERWAVEARQPLYNPARRAEQRQLDLSVDRADLEWAAARQQLMLRTAQRYFELAVATETQRVLERQFDAVQRASDEARDRFRLGDVPVTDIQEAEARLADLQAQRLAAAGDVELARERLADSTGLSAGSLMARLPEVPAAPAPLALDAWLAEADGGNFEIRLRELAREMAHVEASRHSRAASPTVDLVAQAGRDHLAGSGDSSSASNGATNAVIGVQLTVPLFTGGLRAAKELEGIRLADMAAAQVLGARLQTAQAVRSAWRGLNVGAERVRALEQAQAASSTRLDATRLGHQVGDRTTLDLLNAENDAAAARLALAKARVSVAMNRLQLAALAGQLDEGLLRSIDESLQPLTNSEHLPKP